MSQADKIIDAFGGLTATANAVGVSRQLVYYWKKSGAVPARYYRAILDASKKKKAGLKASDLIQ